MSNTSRRAGARCLRRFVLSAAIALLGVRAAPAQDTPTPDERNTLESFRNGGEVSADKVPTDKAKAACAKTARWFAARLVDEKTRDPKEHQGESAVVKDLSMRLGLPTPNSPRGNLEYARTAEKRRPFIDEFGKALVAELEGPALQNSNYIVRINAMRMIAEVGLSGYDGAAETCLKVLAKPNESDAVKFYALQGLRNLFYILPNPPIPANNDLGIPEKTVFQKDNTGQLSPREQRSIQALIDYIFRQPADLKPEDVDGILYVRREAVRALALVRVPRVMDNGKPISWPALALLKVARGDGLNPPSTTPNGPDIRALAERVQAIIGFCSLVQPKSDRDMNIDYAVYHIGRAIQELSPLYKLNSRETSMPWKTQALWLRDALNRWKTSTAENYPQEAPLVAELLDIIDRDILKPIQEADPAAQPNPANLDQWLKANPPKSTSLFKNEPKTTVGIP